MIRSFIFMLFLVCVLWPAGFYCPEGTGFDLRSCPEGTYGPDPGYWSVSQCRQCDGGHYCSSRNGTTVTGPCQEGYYCSHGNTSPQPLLHAAGKHTWLPDLHCMFTNSGNTIQHSLIYPHFVLLIYQPYNYPRKWFTFEMGDKWQLCSLCLSPGEGGPCPAGHYCPQATIHPLPCPRGTFSNLTKLVSQVSFSSISHSYISLTETERHFLHQDGIWKISSEIKIHTEK